MAVFVVGPCGIGPVLQLAGRYDSLELVASVASVLQCFGFEFVTLPDAPVVDLAVVTALPIPVPLVLIVGSTSTARRLRRTRTS